MHILMHRSSSHVNTRHPLHGSASYLSTCVPSTNTLDACSVGSALARVTKTKLHRGPCQLEATSSFQKTKALGLFLTSLPNAHKNEGHLSVPFTHAFQGRILTRASASFARSLTFDWPFHRTFSGRHCDSRLDQTSSRQAVSLHVVVRHEFHFQRQQPPILRAEQA